MIDAIIIKSYVIRYFVSKEKKYGEYFFLVKSIRIDEANSLNQLALARRDIITVDHNQQSSYGFFSIVYRQFDTQLDDNRFIDMAPRFLVLKHTLH